MTMSYLTVTEVAEKWSVSTTWVTILCNTGRIPGAIKKAGRWKIPFDVEKPHDSRKKTNRNQISKFRFVDLFAGIGGFHQAMRFLGGECVMAAEINEACIQTYSLNFKTLEDKIRGDVNKIAPESIPEFDVLCAGFPCQPFSKAGQQKGFKDETRGNLFYKILDIIDAHPEIKFLILENVRNLADKSENWDIICSELMKRDFYITEAPIILSPSDFGIPQIRERVYILGIKKSIRNENVLTNGYIHLEDLAIDHYFKKCKMGDAWSILEENVSNEYLIPEEQELMIHAWDELRQATKIGVIGFPLWISCFGVGIDSTDDLKCSLGYEAMPVWKKNFVNRNREFYLKNRQFIDDWMIRYNMTNRIKLFQKFEWNCGTDVTNIHNTIIQVRQSGIRVKRPTYYPSLVAIVNTPIIWDKAKEHFRYITPREAANLQNFHAKYKFTGTDKQIYHQLGNSVNVRILKILGESLFSLAKENWDGDYDD